MGTRLNSCYGMSVSRDHPHAYGDKEIITLIPCCQLGSSPRVWGQVNITVNKSTARRIIPTRMGTSRQVTPHMCKYEDHPHAYGDKFYSPQNTAVATGSSPRVWGQVIGDLDTSAKLGIIPTRMGTRHSSSEGGCDSGSSPRVWGQGGLFCVFDFGNGIIPTRMGTSKF